MGMKPHQDVTLVDKSLFRKDLVVADTVYSPEKTKMILEAEEAGCTGNCAACASHIETCGNTPEERRGEDDK